MADLKCKFCEAPYNGYDDYCEECGMRLTPYNSKKNESGSQKEALLRNDKCPSCTSVNIEKSSKTLFGKSKNRCKNCGFEW